MSERSSEKSCAMIGVICSLAVNLAAAEITLSPGESCASASCHSDKLHTSVPHDGGPGAQFCGVCHVAEEPGQHQFRFAASGGKLCSQCHAALTRHEHKHAPASAGLCTFCHSAHKSQYAVQLKFPPEALCVSCHNKTVPDGALTIHGPVEQGRCTACHDPHSSGHEFQLVDAMPQLCFGCHDQDQTDHEGKRLPAVEELFVDKSLQQHPPFARGDCALCHEPHASDNYRLQRYPYSSSFYTEFSSDSYFCLMCHGEATFAEPRTLTATKFRNGNLNLHYRHVVRDKGRGCRACHDQHASGLEAQITTDAYLGEQDVGIRAFAKTETGGSCEPLCHRPVEYDRIEPVNIRFMVTPREGIDAAPAELKRASKQHDGKVMFLQRCAGCHGADAEGKIGPPIRGATIDRVMAAIKRVNLMSDLASLDPENLRAIVDSLPAGTPVVALPEGAPDGTVLFSTNCAACHGADASGRIGPDIRGATSAAIAEAIGRVSMMVAMKALSTESRDAISVYLSGLGEGAKAPADAEAVEPPDGKVVFSMYCIGCHGADANGQIGPSIRGVSTSKIGDAIGRVPMMAGLKTLGSAEIGAVGRYLVGLDTGTPPRAAYERVDGKAFYKITCSACHGEDASGHIGPDIRGQTADDVRAAIARAPLMFGLKSSTAEQINAVGDYIHGLADGAPASARAAADGESLFKRHCATCHGSDATGLVGPDITRASAEDITAAIEQVPMMIAMKVLGAREIRATADYLTEIRQ
ncbi:MAG: cytochrome c3 family protein [Woeseia sp.]